MNTPSSKPSEVSPVPHWLSIFLMLYLCATIVAIQKAKDYFLHQEREDRLAQELFETMRSSLRYDLLRGVSQQAKFSLEMSSVTSAQVTELQKKMFGEVIPMDDEIPPREMTIESGAK